LHSSDTGGKKQEYNERAHQLFIVFKKAYDSGSRKILYNILMEFGLSMKLVRLIKICLNETYSKVSIGKHFADNFPIDNGLKRGDASSSPLYNFSLEYAIMKVQENQVELKFNRIYQLLICANDLNLLRDNINTIKGNKETLIDAGWSRSKCKENNVSLE
jgi:hypothetical protein